FEASVSNAAASRVSTPARLAARASARYMAPVSMCGRFSARATSLLVVVLPTPEGPSMATMVITHIVGRWPFAVDRFFSANRQRSTANPLRRRLCARLRGFLASGRSRGAALRRFRVLHRRQHAHFALAQLPPHARRQLRTGDGA